MGNNTKKARVPEICLIAPSQSLADLTRRVAADRGLEVGIYVAVLDDGIKLAEELMSRGPGFSSAARERRRCWPETILRWPRSAPR